MKDFRFIPLTANDVGRLFPFHILLDEEGRILSAGSSLLKAMKIQPGDKLEEHFSINRPFLVNIGLKEIRENLNALFIMHSSRPPLLKLRGQWMEPEGQDGLLFVGSPWFISIQDMKEHGLLIQDFALHDPIIDLLHVIKTNEIGMSDVKEMLSRYKLQQSELRKLSFIATESTNMILVTNSSGEIEWVNRSFEEKTGFSMEEVLGKRSEDFRSGPLTDVETERRMYEMIREGKPFSSELQVYKKDGTTAWIRVNGQPMVESGGKPEHYFTVEEDITEEREAIIKLQISEEKYRNMIQNMELGLVELDTEGRAVFCNDSLNAISGINKATLCHQYVSKLLPERSQRFEKRIRNSEDPNDTSELYEAEICCADGTTKWVLVSKAPLYDTHKKVVGSVKIYLDISRRKQLELELELARNAAEDASTRKEAYLINMSHEIRTPMNIIMGMSRHLTTLIEGEKPTRFLHSIITAAENLLVVINDVLDIAKIEAGKLEIQEIGFELSKTMEVVRQMLGFSAGQKGLQLTVAADTDVPDVLVGDPYRLNQILLNLGGNAIKFTESGSVDIFIFCEQPVTDHVLLKFVIEDTGIGIGSEKLGQVFEHFGQEDASVARKYGGTGLGLNISQQLARLMGGDLKIDSMKGMGTHVTLELPFRIGTTEDIRLSDQVAHYQEQLKGIDILVVEDNSMNLMLAQSVLESFGAAVTTADSGEEALRKLTGKTFDVILMDIQMPGMNGIETTKLIRGKLGSKTPVIALTANTSAEIRDSLQEAGFNDHLLKPYQEHLLLRKILQQLGKNGAVEIESKNQRVSTGNSLYNTAKLEEFTVNNPMFLKKMLELFLEENSIAFEKLNHAVAGKEYQVAADLAHKMKPGFDQLMITELFEGIKKLEALAKQQDPGNEIGPLLSRLDTFFKQVREEIRANELND